MTNLFEQPLGHCNFWENRDSYPRHDTPFNDLEAVELKRVEPIDLFLLQNRLKDFPITAVHFRKEDRLSSQIPGVHGAQSYRPGGPQFS